MELDMKNILVSYILFLIFSTNYTTPNKGDIVYRTTFDTKERLELLNSFQRRKSPIWHVSINSWIVYEIGDDNYGSTSIGHRSCF